MIEYTTASGNTVRIPEKVAARLSGGAEPKKSPAAKPVKSAEAKVASLATKVATKKAVPTE